MDLGQLTLTEQATPRVELFDYDTVRRMIDAMTSSSGGEQTFFSPHVFFRQPFLYLPFLRHHIMDHTLIFIYCYAQPFLGFPWRRCWLHQGTVPRDALCWSCPHHATTTSNSHYTPFEHSEGPTPHCNKYDPEEKNKAVYNRFLQAYRTNISGLGEPFVHSISFCLELQLMVFSFIDFIRT
jgi:hypothetical protein